MTTEITHNTNTKTGAEIWNPGAAANLSLVFSPLFGAYLHYRNWQILGEQERAAAAKKWLYAGIGLLAVTTLGALADKNLSGLWLVFLFAWYFAAAKAQIKYVKEWLGASYQRKSMVKPSGIALASLVAYIGIFATAVTLNDSNGADATTAASESERTVAEQESPEPPAIPFEDFYVDFNEYVGQEIVIEGLMLPMGDQAYLYKDEGSTIAVTVDNSDLSREEKKLIITECGEGCLAKIAVQPIGGSNPKTVKALRFMQ